MLLIAVEAPLLTSTGKKVSIRAAMAENREVFRGNADLFAQLAGQGFLPRFALVDASLRKLPGAVHPEPLTDEDFAARISQNPRDIRAKLYFSEQHESSA